MAFELTLVTMKQPWIGFFFPSTSLKSRVVHY